MKLQDYDFTLKHILGKTNTKADILSRKEQVDTKEDNKDVQLLKDEMWTKKMTAKVTMLRRKVMAEESDIVKRIRRNNIREKEIVQALEKNNGLAWEEDGVAYIEGRIYVPNNKKLREEILKEHHNPADIGHPGQHRMLELLKRTYWWPGLKEDIKRYVQGCFKCQQNKVQHQRMDVIVVIVDRFTKMICLKAATTNISLEGIAKIYRDDIWKLYGILRKILSDRGPQFASKFMEEFTKALGTKRQLSTAYYP